MVNKKKALEQAKTVKIIASTESRGKYRLFL